MIGPSRYAGMRTRASGGARLETSSYCFSERALALSELTLFPISLTRCQPSGTCDAGSRGSASLSAATASASQIAET